MQFLQNRGVASRRGVMCCHREPAYACEPRADRLEQSERVDPPRGGRLDEGCRRAHVGRGHQHPADPPLDRSPRQRDDRSGQQRLGLRVATRGRGEGLPPLRALDLPERLLDEREQRPPLVVREAERGEQSLARVGRGHVPIAARPARCPR